MAHICRIEGDSPGWRLTYKNKYGNTKQVRFSDKKYKGRRKAKSAAYRESSELIKDLKDNKIFDKEKRQTKYKSELSIPSHNKSGYAGVFLRRNKYKEKTYYYWNTLIYPSAKTPKQICFSVRKFGFNNAKDLAIKCRLDWEKADRSESKRELNNYFRRVDNGYYQKVEV